MSHCMFVLSQASVGQWKGYLGKGLTLGHKPRSFALGYQIGLCSTPNPWWTAEFVWINAWGQNKSNEMLLIFEKFIAFSFGGGFEVWLLGNMLKCCFSAKLKGEALQMEAKPKNLTSQVCMTVSAWLTVAAGDSYVNVFMQAWTE